MLYHSLKVLSVFSGTCALHLCDSFLVSHAELVDSASDAGRLSRKAILFDHRPLQLNEDDYLRVCQIPKRKVGCRLF